MRLRKNIRALWATSAAVAVVVGPSGALGQQQSAPAQLPEITVETTGTPTPKKASSAQLTSSPSPAQMEAMPTHSSPPPTQPFARQQSVMPQQFLSSNDSARLFQSVPGMSFQTGGGVSALPYLNGFGDDRLKVVVNGMTLTSSCGNHMNPALSYIDATAVDKISVVAGVTPVSMGGDSLGGTIAVDSAAPLFATSGEGAIAGGRLSAFYRSNGNGFGATAHAYAATEDVSIAYTGSTTRASNYEDGSGREVYSSLYKATNHLLSAAGRSGNNQFGVDFGWQSIPYQGFVNQYMDMTDNKSFSVNAHYKGQFDWGFLEGRVYRQSIRHSMNMLEDKASLGWDMPMETRGSDTGYAFKAGLQLTEATQLRVGHEYHRYRLDDWWPPLAGAAPMMGPNTYWNINDGKRDRTSVFGELETDWSSTWTTLVGVRLDRVVSDTGPVQGYSPMMMYAADANAFNSLDRKRTDTNVDVTATARYEPAATHAFEFGAARKTRSPNLYERYAWSNATMAGTMVNWFGDLNAYVGNPDLKPEIAHSARASAEWHDAAHRDWHFKVSGYLTYVDDYINVETNTIGGAPPPGRTKLRFVNHDARLAGVDIEASKALGYAWGDWRVSGVFSYVAGRDLDADTYLYNIMPANVRVALTHTLGNWSNTVELQGVAAKNNVDVVRLEPRTSAYALVNWRSSYAMDNVRFDFGIDNVFDTDYELPLGGLSAYVYNRDAANLDHARVHGPGRSFNVGMTVDF